jgi:exonuclease SbcC
VTEAIEEILGLNRDQFSQIVMIAQGDFLKVLNSDSATRSTVFRKLFNTNYCLNLQIRLREAARAKRGEYESLKKSILEQAAQVKDVGFEEIASEQREQIEIWLEKQNAQNWQQFLQFLQAVCEDDQEKLKLAEQKKKRLELELELVVKELHYAAEKETMKNSLAKEIENKSALEIGQKAKLEHLDELNNQEAEIEKEKKVVIELGSQLPKYQELDELLVEVSKLNENLEKAKEQKSKIQEDFGALNKEETIINETLFLNKEAGAELVATRNRLDLNNEKLKQAEKLKLDFDSYLLLEKDLVKKQKDFMLVEEQYQKISQNLLNIRGEFYRSQAGILAADLVDGEPCPVCGAIHHPDKAVLTETSVNQEKLTQAEELEEEKKTAWQAIALEVAEHKKTIELKGVNLIAQLKEEFQLEFELGNIQLSQKIEELIGEYNSFGLKYQQEVKNLKNQVNENLKLEERLAAIRPLKEKFLAAIPNLSGEEASLSSQIQSTEKSIEKLKAELTYPDLATIKKEIENKNKRVDLFAKSLNQAKEALDKANKDLNIVAGKVEQLNQQLQKLPEFDLLSLQEKELELRNEKDTVEENVEGFKNRSQNLQRVAKRIEQRGKNMHSSEDEIARLQELSDTANGTLSGKEKLTFEAFVQGFYFDQVINAANLRLSTMCNDRYRLERSQSADARSKSGLDLEVFDAHTGKLRSVKSLSGGESFEASLALALGLSDIVQNQTGGIEISTLFIDEGFGSLDSDSLEKAINMLNSLSEGNRLVGIISHVAELRERIDQKIMVKKSPIGSTLTMEYF